MRQPLRQGDILLIPLVDIPPGLAARPIPAAGVVVAEGEATGHCHTIAGDVVEYATTADHVDRFLRVGSQGAVLTHDEHGTITVPEGAYRAVRQREYAPEAPRYVAD